MTKKQDHIAQEQSRDKHPEHLMKGSGAEVASRGAQAKGNPADHQQPGTGKVANDHNKQGAQAKTQTNQHERTPGSRHDRENQAGAHNEIQARTGGKGGGRSPRGAG
jgi:hypothetical protein